MKKETLRKKWHNKPIEDAISCNSEEFIKFANDMKKYVKEVAGTVSATLTKWNVGHYYVSGFVRKGDKVVYISYSVPRGEAPVNMDNRTPSHSVLYREAESESDFHGKQNHFCSLMELEEDLPVFLEH